MQSCRLTFILMVIFNILRGVKIGSLLFSSVACLAALQRHGECLALVNKRLEEETENPDLFIMRARLHELFRNVRLSTFNFFK